MLGRTEANLSVCTCGSPSCLDHQQTQPLAELEPRATPHPLKRNATCKSLFSGIAVRCRTNMQRDRRRVAVGVVGLALLLAAGAVYLLDPLERVITWQTSVEEGSAAFEMWRKPPLSMMLNVYLFNVTNPQQFLAGTDKLQLQEVGPYVYRELLENANTTFNPNGTVTFIPRRQLVFVPENSVGDPLRDTLTLPNIPLLGAVSMLHSSSIFTNLALRSITRYLDSQPLLNLTVHDILFGYEDPLVRLANNVVPSFIGFDQFGLLDRMYAQQPGGDVVSMRAGRNKGVDPADPNPWLHDVFSLDTYNGSPGLAQWGYGTRTVYDPRTNQTVLDERPCSMVRGSLEGFMFPRRITPANRFYVYRHAFCRTFPAKFSHEGLAPGGFTGLWFKLEESSMDPAVPENSCFCDQGNGDCVPKGMTDVSPCYFGIPLALSKPHFFQGEQWLVDKVGGMNPDADKHESYLVIQPDLGVLLSIRARIQLNLVMKKSKMHPRVAPFDNLIIPFFWADFSVEELPQNIQMMVKLALYVGPVVQAGTIVLLALMGLVMVALAVAGRGRTSGKQHYSSVRILPPGK